VKIDTESRVLLWIVAVVGVSVPGCIAQGLDVGTAAQMPDPNGAKMALQVTADDNYVWKLDGVDQGPINPAMGAKHVMTAIGRHEIVAKGADGRTRFDRIFTVAAGKPNVIGITGRAATPGRPANSASSSKPSIPTPIGPATPQQPAPAPGRPERLPGSPTTAMPTGPLENPDMFVRIQLQAGKGSAGKPRVRTSATPTPDDGAWQVTASVIPIRGTYYDVKLQIVMKDIGDGRMSVELPDPQPGPVSNFYITKAEALGKEAVVCYTGRLAAQQAQRWTGTFSIQSGYQGRVVFVPAHEPTLEPAGDSPCGGVVVTKAAPLPSVPEGPGPREASINSIHASLALAQGSRLYNARRYSEARPLLIEACESGGSVDACNSVGFMYQNRMGVVTDYAKAKEYYLKACNDDSALSCSNLGSLYRDGLGVARDYHQAAGLFEKGCDAGVPQGCELAGKMYLDSMGVPQDGPRALDFFKRACEADLAAGCGDEGYMYAKGSGVPNRDMPFAVSLFKHACELGSPNSCFSIGMIYRTGDGVARDEEKAKQYLTRACDLGDRESCGPALR
jgi:TPR repeat protein